MLKPRGFTLIELLIVIAIIALLAAILFPVFATAREKARQTSCLSNCKQIGLALMQYATDFDEHYPGGMNPSVAATGWAGQVYPYVKSTAVFKCPDDTNANSGNWTSYGMNINLAVRNYTVDKNTGAEVSQLNAPAMTVLLFEVTGNADTDITVWYEDTSPAGYGLGTLTGYGWDPDGNNSAGTCTSTTPSLKYATGDLGQRGDNCFFSQTTGRHNEGSIWVLADGHAKWFNGSLISSGGNAAKQSAAQVFSVSGPAAAGTAGTISGQPIAATFSII